MLAVVAGMNGRYYFEGFENALGGTCITLIDGGNPLVRGCGELTNAPTDGAIQRVIRNLPGSDGVKSLALMYFPDSVVRFALIDMLGERSFVPHPNVGVAGLDASFAAVTLRGEAPSTVIAYDANDEVGRWRTGDEAHGAR